MFLCALSVCQLVRTIRAEISKILEVLKKLLNKICRKMSRVVNTANKISISKSNAEVPKIEHKLKAEN